MFAYELIDDVIESLGRCDVAQALKRISMAVQALQDEGDWNANIGVLDLPISTTDGMVSLPSAVETPLAVAVNGVPVFSRDSFFRYHLNGDGFTEDNMVQWAWDDSGFSGSFMDIITPGRMLCKCELLSDVGKIIRVFGREAAGRNLRDQGLDGQWIDGIQFYVDKLASIPTIFPTTREFRRTVVVTPRQILVLVGHQLATGALVKLSGVGSNVPEPAQEGSSFYIGVDSPDAVRLYLSRLDAKAQQGAISFSRIDANSQVSLEDRRVVTVKTKFTTPTNHNLSNYDLVSFSADQVPVPLEAALPYVARAEGNTSLTIYANKSDAELSKNAINISTPGVNVQLRALKKATPATTLNFSVRHNYTSGDAVTVANSGGKLPAPILAGVQYYLRVINPFSVTIHATLDHANTNQYPIALETVGSGTNSLVKVIAASATIGNSSNITTATPHGFSAPTGSGAAAAVTLNAQSVVGITISAPGSGYEAPPSISIVGGAGTGATAEATVSGGLVTSLRMITGGTGYTSTPTVVITPTGGSYVSFTTNGTLPAPLANGIVYRAENPMNTQTFTVNSTVPEPVQLTSAGSGQLFVVVSRSFSVGFLPQWVVDVPGLPTGGPYQVYCAEIFPTTAPPLSSEGSYYVRQVNSRTIELYDSLVNAQTVGSVSGRLSTIAAGVGTVYLYTNKSVAAQPMDSLLTLASSGYLSTPVDVTLLSSLSLPSPLQSNTTYSAVITNGRAELKLAGVPVVLTDVGNGTHEISITRVFAVPGFSTLDIPHHQLQDGAAITLSSSSTLPVPFLPNVTYYARSISSGTVELYALLAQALDTLSTVGRVNPTTIGSGAQVLHQQLPSPEWSVVDRVEKEVFDGSAQVLVSDVGRTNGLSLIADMDPTETVTAYRRIRVFREAQHVRMKYRRKSVNLLTLRDFINLDSRLAIIMMVQSQDLLMKRFIDESERYRILAVEYLNKRNRAVLGPQNTFIQINADLTTRPDDFM